MVGSSFACFSDDRLVCKFGNSKISSVEPEVLVLRVGGSPRGWFNEFVSENNLEFGDWDCEEPHFWIRVYELAGCCGQVRLDGGANLENVARVIQSFVYAVYKSVPVDWSIQKVFVTGLPAGDRNADSMLLVDVNSFRGNDDCGGRESRGTLRLRPSFHSVPSSLLAVNPSTQTWAKEMEKTGTRNAASAGVSVLPEPTSWPISLGLW